MIESVACKVCNRIIHRNTDFGGKWYNEYGNLCIKGLEHLPQEKGTITETELRLAVVRAEKKTDCEFPAALAGMILDEVRAMRDPYPIGSTWKDADGIIWHKSGEDHWVRPGFSERFPLWAPKAPLKRMVTDDEPPF
jgi:hypothetical protein